MRMCQRPRYTYPPDIFARRASIITIDSVMHYRGLKTTQNVSKTGINLLDAYVATTQLHIVLKYLPKELKGKRYFHIKIFE